MILAGRVGGMTITPFRLTDGFTSDSVVLVESGTVWKIVCGDPVLSGSLSRRLVTDFSARWSLHVAGPQ